MKVIKFEKKTDRPTIAIGVHIATLIQILDIGIQPGFTYKGKAVPPSSKLLFLFEFPNLKDKDGKPVNYYFDIFFSEYVGSQLNLYANALLGGTEAVAKELEEEMDLRKLLGKSAQLQIGATEPKDPNKQGAKSNPKILSIMALPEGFPTPVPSVTPSFFDIDNPDLTLFRTLIDWVQDKIRNASNAPASLRDKSVVITPPTEPTEENF